MEGGRQNCFGLSWRYTVLKPCTPAGVRGAQSSGHGACFHMLLPGLGLLHGRRFHLSWPGVLGAQSSAHRTCAAATFCGRQVTLFLSSSGLSATCCHGCFCHHCTVTRPGLDPFHSEVFSFDGAVRLIPRCTAFLSFSIDFASRFPPRHLEA